jgi:hypothetical protein
MDFRWIDLLAQSGNQLLYSRESIRTATMTARVIAWSLNPSGSAHVGSDVFPVYCVNDRNNFGAPVGCIINLLHQCSAQRMRSQSLRSFAAFLV